MHFMREIVVSIIILKYWTCVLRNILRETPHVASVLTGVYTARVTAIRAYRGDKWRCKIV